jgi:hypothetical protein
MWLGDLAGRRGLSSRVLAHASFVRHWAGPSPFRSLVERRAQRIATDIGALLRRLVEANLVTRETVEAFRLRFRLDVTDRRRGKKKPLPWPRLPSRPPWRENRRPRGEEIDT